MPGTGGTGSGDATGRPGGSVGGHIIGQRSESSETVIDDTNNVGRPGGPVGGDDASARGRANRPAAADRRRADARGAASRAKRVVPRRSAP
jgi:hypothetical protein